MNDKDRSKRRMRSNKLQSNYDTNRKTLKPQRFQGFLVETAGLEPAEVRRGAAASALPARCARSTRLRCEVTGSRIRSLTKKRPYLSIRSFSWWRLLDSNQRKSAAARLLPHFSARCARSTRLRREVTGSRIRSLTKKDRIFRYGLFLGGDCWTRTSGSPPRRGCFRTFPLAALAQRASGARSLVRELDP